MSQAQFIESTTGASAAQPAQAAAAREHIAYIEYSRGLAILLIVTGHTYALAWTHNVNEDPTASVSLYNLVLALINGGTAYFVFISGFLYRQVFYGRVSYGAFMRKKALYVGLPYLIIATPLAIAEILHGEFSVSLVKEGVPYAESYFIDLMVLLSTGRMVTAYWYIPCVFLLFLASPLFDRFVRMASPGRAAVLAVAILIALWVHRPLDNLNPVQSFLYLVNFYLLGILFCEHRRVILEFVTANRVLLLLTALLVTVAATQAVVTRNVENIERAVGDGWLPIGLDLMLVQKYVGIFALCGLLARFGSMAHAPLHLMAKHSFGIFFVHGVVLALMIRLPGWATPHVGKPFVDLMIYAAFVVAISLAVVLAVKAVTGKYSRYIIGS